jgi:hypothetical protein
MCEVSCTFKPEHVNTGKGGLQAWSNYFQREHKHEHVTVNIGQPPGRALFTVKSRTYLANQARWKSLHHFQIGIIFGMCSEHGPICHLFELILVIHVDTSNGTNHFIEHVFVGISRSHGCYHKLTYHAQANMSYHKLTNHGHVRLIIANLRT